MNNFIKNTHKKDHRPKQGFLKTIVFFLVFLIIVGGIFILRKHNKNNTDLMLQKISKLDEDRKVYNPSKETNGTYYVFNNKIYYKTDHPTNDPYKTYPSDNVVSADVVNFRGYICASGDSYRCEYGIDSSSVYYEGKKIKNIDNITFELILNKKGEFIKDKNYVYSPDGKHIIEGSDPNSFELLEDGDTFNTDLATDNNFIFQKNKSSFFVKNNEVDRKSLEIIYRDHVVTYLKDKNFVYYKNRDDNEIKKILGADRNSFNNINQDISKDNNFIFFRKNYSMEKIKNIDPKNFHHISGNWYKTSKNMYYIKYDEIMLLDNVDPSNFEILEGDIGANLNSIYYQNKVIDDIDRKTFKKVGESPFFVDKNGLYKGVIKVDMSDMDTSSFHQIGTHYFKDNNQIYFYDYYEITVVQNADLKTFTPVCYECEYAEDKNNKFHGAMRKNF